MSDTREENTSQKDEELPPQELDELQEHGEKTVVTNLNVKEGEVEYHYKQGDLYPVIPAIIYILGEIIFFLSRKPRIFQVDCLLPFFWTCVLGILIRAREKDPLFCKYLIFIKTLLTKKILTHPFLLVCVPALSIEIPEPQPKEEESSDDSGDAEANPDASGSSDSDSDSTPSFARLLEEITGEEGETEDNGFSIVNKIALALLFFAAFYCLFKDIKNYLNNNRIINRLYKGKEKKAAFSSFMIFGEMQCLFFLELGNKLYFKYFERKDEFIPFFNMVLDNIDLSVVIVFAIVNCIIIAFQKMGTCVDYLHFVKIVTLLLYIYGIFYLHSSYNPTTTHILVAGIVMMNYAVGSGILVCFYIFKLDQAERARVNKLEEEEKLLLLSHQ